MNFFHREEEPDDFNSPESINDREEPQSYPFWMAIFSGVAVLIAGLLHAAFWKPFSMIFGAIVSSGSIILYTCYYVALLESRNFSP